MERKGGKGDTARHDTSYSILNILRDPCILFASQLFCCLFSLSNVPFIRRLNYMPTVFIEPCSSFIFVTLAALVEFTPSRPSKLTKTSSNSTCLACFFHTEKNDIFRSKSVKNHQRYFLSGVDCSHPFLSRSSCLSSCSHFVCFFISFTSESFYLEKSKRKRRLVWLICSLVLLNLPT